MSREAGVKAYEEKDYGKALKIWLDMIDSHCAVASDYYNIGVCYMKMEKYQEASTYLKEAIKKGYNDSKAFFNMGFAYSKLNENKKAHIYFETALALNPDDYDAIVALRLIDVRLIPSMSERNIKDKGERIKETKAVVYYYKNDGFSIYTYTYYANGHCQEKFDEKVECKKINTKEFNKTKKGLLKKYDTDCFIIVN